MKIDKDKLIEKVKEDAPYYLINAVSVGVGLTIGRIIRKGIIER